MKLSSTLAGSHPRSLSLGGFAPRSGRGRFSTLAVLAAAVVLSIGPSTGAAGLLKLDVVATDDRGVPIKDLRPAEFEVWINGFQIPIQHVTFVSPASASDGRIIVLLLDDMAVEQALVPRIREAARRFVDRMAPGDRIAVVSLNGTAMEVTADRAKLLQAIDNHYIRLVQMRLEDAGAQVLNTVTTISRQLAESPGGRNAIVAIGAGWLLDTPIPPLAASRDLRPEWVAAMQASAAAHVTFYVIDPAGVGTRRANGGTSGFARETGGYAFMNTNDLAGASDRILRELDTYYVLAVEDPPFGRKADLRELEIKVLRRGVTARARRGILPGL
jgi:VWFA-related protein